MQTINRSTRNITNLTSNCDLSLSNNSANLSAILIILIKNENHFIFIYFYVNLHGRDHEASGVPGMVWWDNWDGKGPPEDTRWAHATPVRLGCIISLTHKLQSGVQKRWIFLRHAMICLRYRCIGNPIRNILGISYDRKYIRDFL